MAEKEKKGMLIVKVGYEYALVTKEQVKHISLVKDGEMEYQGTTYPRYHASSFEESEKLDHLFDSGAVETFRLK